MDSWRKLSTAAVIGQMNNEHLKAMVDVTGQGTLTTLSKILGLIIASGAERESKPPPLQGGYIWTIPEIAQTIEELDQQELTEITQFWSYGLALRLQNAIDLELRKRVLQGKLFSAKEADRNHAPRESSP